MTDRLHVAVLAALLSKTSLGDRAEETAETLLRRYTSLRALCEADAASLAVRDGLPESAVILIRLLPAITSRRLTDRMTFGVRHAEHEITDHLVAYYFGKPVEEGSILLFDEKDRLLSHISLGEGTVNYSDILPRKIIEYAMRAGATKVMIAHNHPGGTAVASDADLRATEALRATLERSGIRLLAHYVVAELACCRVDRPLYSFGAGTGVNVASKR